MTLRPFDACLSTSWCTFVTRGQVASIYANPRRSASARTDAATPCAENDDRGTVWNRIELVDKDGALRKELLDYVGIVDDFMPDEDRRAKPLQGFLYGSDRPFDARAKATRLGQKDGKRSHSRNSNDAPSEHLGALNDVLKNRAGPRIMPTS
jgi:hypothetical protein